MDPISWKQRRPLPAAPFLAICLAPHPSTGCLALPLAQNFISFFTFNPIIQIRRRGRCCDD
jgi:hypothetical protein